MQNHIPMTAKKSKSKPGAELFNCGGRLFPETETSGSSISAVDWDLVEIWYVNSDTYKTTKINFITSRAVDWIYYAVLIISTAHDLMKLIFCCFVCNNNNNLIIMTSTSTLAFF